MSETPLLFSTIFNSSFINALTNDLPTKRTTTKYSSKINSIPIMSHVLKTPNSKNKEANRSIQLPLSQKEKQVLIQLFNLKNTDRDLEQDQLGTKENNEHKGNLNSFNEENLLLMMGNNDNLPGGNKNESESESESENENEFGSNKTNKYKIFNEENLLYSFQNEKKKKKNKKTEKKTVQEIEEENFFQNQQPFEIKKLNKNEKEKEKEKENTNYEYLKTQLTPREDYSSLLFGTNLSVNNEELHVRRQSLEIDPEEITGSANNKLINGLPLTKTEVFIEDERASLRAVKRIDASTLKLLKSDPIQTYGNIITVNQKYLCFYAGLSLFVLNRNNGSFASIDITTNPILDISFAGDNLDYLSVVDSGNSLDIWNIASNLKTFKPHLVFRILSTDNKKQKNKDLVNHKKQKNEKKGILNENIGISKHNCLNEKTKPSNSNSNSNSNNNNKPLKEFPINGKNEYFTRCVWHPKNKDLIVTANSNHDAIVMDLKIIKRYLKNTSCEIELSNITEGLYILHGHTKPITDLVFSYSGDFVATSSLDGTVKYWNYLTCKCVKTITPFNGSPVNSVIFVEKSINNDKEELSNNYNKKKKKNEFQLNRKSEIKNKDQDEIPENVIILEKSSPTMNYFGIKQQKFLNPNKDLHKILIIGGVKNSVIKIFNTKNWKVNQTITFGSSRTRNKNTNRNKNDLTLIGNQINFKQNKKQNSSINLIKMDSTFQFLFVIEEQTGRFWVLHLKQSNELLSLQNFNKRKFDCITRFDYMVEFETQEPIYNFCIINRSIRNNSISPRKGGFESDINNGNDHYKYRNANDKNNNFLNRTNNGKMVDSNMIKNSKDSFELLVFFLQPNAPKKCILSTWECYPETDQESENRNELVFQRSRRKENWEKTRKKREKMKEKKSQLDKYQINFKNPPKKKILINNNQMDLNNIQNIGDHNNNNNNDNDNNNNNKINNNNNKININLNFNANGNNNFNNEEDEYKDNSNGIENNKKKKSMNSNVDNRNNNQNNNNNENGGNNNENDNIINNENDNGYDVRDLDLFFNLQLEKSKQKIEQKNFQLISKYNKQLQEKSLLLQQELIIKSRRQHKCLIQEITKSLIQILISKLRGIIKNKLENQIKLIIENLKKKDANKNKLKINHENFKKEISNQLNILIFQKENFLETLLNHLIKNINVILIHQLKVIFDNKLKNINNSIQKIENFSNQLNKKINLKFKKENLLINKKFIKDLETMILNKTKVLIQSINITKREISSIFGINESVNNQDDDDVGNGGDDGEDIDTSKIKKLNVAYKLLGKNKCEEAFTLILEEKDLNLSLKFCEKIILKNFFRLKNFPLSQITLLVLINQLSSELNKQTELKINWLTNLLLKINLKDQSVIKNWKLIRSKLNQGIQSLNPQQMDQSSELYKKLELLVNICRKLEKK
ncbi:enhancer of mRNA-decapping protein [Anaeramoeba flamelloides]|uniref:Enhancer of mRNA-decapping protein n=1 Tax=Anaeramoeba flamelloides TaxID=1746091 RepID=A0AAV8AED0_9EUKA|nr:enhancer of mRNA-decapping protein [Anaeramoeba flamelloides]